MPGNIEVMDNGGAEDDEGEDDDVYAWYVKVCHILPRAGLNLIVLIVSGWRTPRWPWAPRRLSRSTGTFILLHSLPARTISMREEHVPATACATAQAGCGDPTHLDHRDRPALRGDEHDNDHDGDDDDDDNNGTAHCDGRRIMQDGLSEPSVTDGDHKLRS